jgi:hypothetical protein
MEVFAGKDIRQSRAAHSVRRHFVRASGVEGDCARPKD